MRPRYLDFIVRIVKPAEPHCLDCKIGRIRTFSRPYRAGRIARAGKYLDRKMVGAENGWGETLPVLYCLYRDIA